MISSKKEVSDTRIITILLTSIFTFFLSFIIFSIYSSTNLIPSGDIFQPIEFENQFCIYTTGDFEGRETQPHQDFLETVVCKHNLFYDSGANATRNSLGGKGNPINATTIALCNSTNASNCGAPVASATELFGMYEACGLGPANGTFTDFADTGNWTVSFTFTSSCDTQSTNVSRLLGVDKTNFSSASFSSVTLNTNDRLIANWSQGIS